MTYGRAKISRRDFIRLACMATVGLVLAGCRDDGASPGVEANPSILVAETTVTSVADENSSTLVPAAGDVYMAVARGADPQAITQAALAALGGMERFVKTGMEVVIKPNICTDYHPAEYATTTNPVVVATLVSLCLEVGAKRVRVMDNPFGGTAKSAYATSGIADAVEAAGGEMHVMSPVKFKQYDIPEGVDLKSFAFYQEAMEADVLIDVPIAKHHSQARLTLGGKNLMGIIEDRGSIHQNLGTRIVDLVSRVRPTLTVVDAYRILMAHGPTGGSLDDVNPTQTVIASHDIVAADAYAATLFGLSGTDIAYVREAAQRGLGTLDLSTIKIEEVNV